MSAQVREHERKEVKQVKTSEHKESTWPKGKTVSGQERNRKGRSEATESDTRMV